MRGGGVSGAQATLTQTASELRRAFDAGFADSPPSVQTNTEPMLAIRLAADPYALRLADVAGLFKDRRVTLLPGALRHFRGVAGLPGRLVPVYDLRTLVGCTPTANARWLVLVLAPEPLGLAFDSFEGQFAPPPGSLTATMDGDRRHVSHAVRAGEILRPVIDVTSVVQAVRNQIGSEEPAKER